MAHPCDLTPEQWDGLLDEMIYAIDTFLKDDGWERDAASEARVLAGFKLFHDRFFDLWW